MAPNDDFSAATGHPVAQTGTIEVRPLWGN
jgi:hypothetical protein